MQNLLELGYTKTEGSASIWVYTNLHIPDWSERRRDLTILDDFTHLKRRNFQVSCFDPQLYSGNCQALFLTRDRVQCEVWGDSQTEPWTKLTQMAPPKHNQSNIFGFPLLCSQEKESRHHPGSNFLFTFLMGGDHLEKDFFSPFLLATAARGKRARIAQEGWNGCLPFKPKSLAADSV